MDLITLTIGIAVGACGAGVAVGVFGAAKIEQLREKLAAREATIDYQCERISADAKELCLLGDRCSELRIACRDKDQANENLQRRIAELEPDAERGRKQREQSRRALEAAQRKNRERHAAKLATSNVAPIERRRA